MQRGEVHGFGGETWVSLGEIRGLLEQGSVKVVLQYGYKRHAKLANVPSLIEFAQTDEERQSLGLLMARQEFGRPFLAPPGVPPDRLYALRRAFDATMADPQFREEAERQQLEIDPLTGEEVSILVEKLALTPKPIIDRVERILSNGQLDKN